MLSLLLLRLSRPYGKCWPGLSPSFSLSLSSSRLPLPLSLSVSPLSFYFASVLEAHDREYVIIERFLPTAGIKDDTRVFFSSINNYNRLGPNREMERLKGEGGIGRSRSGKSNVLRRWKISREKERERDCYSKDGREIFRVCVCICMQLLYPNWLIEPAMLHHRAILRVDYRSMKQLFK